MLTKYDFDCPKEVIEKDIARLTNQLWKILPMYENGEDWQKQLDTVILEIAGLYNIFIQVPQFLQLLSKLEGLRQQDNGDNNFQIYRKVVFEAISLLQEIKRYE